MNVYRIAERSARIRADLDAFEAIRADQSVGTMEKYTGTLGEFLRHSRLAESLNLDCESRRILDVGCGFGFFVSICDCMGHTVVGLDRDEPIIRRGQEAVWKGGPWVTHEITPALPLPADIGQFDLVTVFRCWLPDLTPIEDVLLLGGIFRHVVVGGWLHVDANYGHDDRIEPAAKVLGLDYTREETIIRARKQAT